MSAVFMTLLPDLRAESADANDHRIQRTGLGKSIVRRIWSGELKLHYSPLGLVAHDRDGVVIHEFPTPEEVEREGFVQPKYRKLESLKFERDPSGEFPFPESKLGNYILEYSGPIKSTTKEN